MRWERRSSNWTSFSSRWARTWDDHEVEVKGEADGPLCRRFRNCCSEKEAGCLPQNGEARREGLEGARRARVLRVCRRGPQGAVRHDAVPETRAPQEWRDGSLLLDRLPLQEAPQQRECEGHEGSPHEQPGLPEGHAVRNEAHGLRRLQNTRLLVIRNVAPTLLRAAFLGSRTPASGAERSSCGRLGRSAP